MSIRNDMIDKILYGIDKDCTIDENGWFETSTGADYGAKQLKLLKEYINKEKNDTEIKDINDKPIYADSSIFSFDLLDLNLEDIECGRRTYQGFFRWNQDTLSYHIHYDNCGEIFNEIKYCPATFENFEIIDTIQEKKEDL